MRRGSRRIARTSSMERHRVLREGNVVLEQYVKLLQITDPIFLVNVEGYVVGYNRRASDLAGVALEEGIGRHHHEVLPSARVQPGHCSVCHGLWHGSQGVPLAPVRVLLSFEGRRSSASVLRVPLGSDTEFAGLAVILQNSSGQHGVGAD